DMDGFDKAMTAQRERARAASSFKSSDSLPAELASRLQPTEFLGYEALTAEACKVSALVREGRSLDALNDGDKAVVILERTPFYAESGGQVGDTGTLEGACGRFVVHDTRKLGGVFFAHFGRWQGEQALKVGDTLDARVDAERRQAIVLNHSATHLLHAALRQVLGEHVTQKGSLVAPERLRFDFAHSQPVSAAELAEIEVRVNTEIRRNVAAEIRHMGYDDAIASGAMALFGEKYGDEVRVLSMGDFSTELCGGTHVGRTGDIGLFRILSESGVASGVRRIEAVTGAAALDQVGEQAGELRAVGQLLSTHGGDVVGKLQQLLARQKDLEHELERLKAKAASAATGDLAGGAVDVEGIKLLAARVDGLDRKALRDSVDRLKQQLGDCVVVLAAGADGKVALVAGVHGAASGRINAGAVVAHVAARIGGKGGGRADMAQGGGEDSPALDTALAELPGWLAGQTS
ncbi:MAG TPA: DHHA1 domain-containing protein, partial [Oleiagrimonas sp.]|nr:DHHA1 domain-containing protein [Oleiagrimonas sp.]